MTELPAGRTAVVLFNLGGPDGPRSVRPFLFNLFNDRAIIDASGPVRWLLAQFISRRRAPVSRAIYDHLDGGSPLLANSQAQATALGQVLNETVTESESNVRVFIAMRYWSPRATDTARQVAAWQPDRVLLLPLYPQFSTTTSGSSLADWDRAAARVALAVPTQRVCCWPLNAGWIAAQAALVADGLARCTAEAPHAARRILFSAHGLPEKIVAGGDPYAWQVEQTAAAVIAALQNDQSHHSYTSLSRGDDWQVCYQSRVGPLQWIKPDTDSEIARAGADSRALVVVPIAFVSEHSETLVELDIEYRDLARHASVPAYVRAPAVADRPDFINGLADVVATALTRSTDQPISEAGRRLCPSGFGRCPCAA